MSGPATAAAGAAHAASLALVLPSDPVQLAVAGFLARYKPRTRETYAQHLQQYLRWVARHGLHPFDMRRPHLELWLRDLEAQGLMSATRSSRFGIVSLFYRFAVMDELLERDPTVHVKRPKIYRGEQRRTWLPLVESVQLLHAAKAAGPREHVLIALLSIVAMRVGEVSSLDVADVGRRGGWWTVTFVGKGGDTYTEVVPPAAVPDLERLVVGRDGAEPLLVNAGGRRLDRRSATTVLARLCRDAGITRDITPHGLRRAAATNMLAQGVPPRAVQRKLRHQDLRTTLLYDQSEATLDQSAALPYAAALYGALSG